ncbi:carbon-nitrogen hydrolase [Actinomycetospora sp. NBRC 106375]|uniref:nitrilase-related carbon-nitrogen hydrolase n=1 Tax=Actinomycetospora sp. NBRC 106375 TaxID=3032207 RepID=UPI0024A1DC1D|nr:nitrilase-related carbon-nitrogen hydrolase [Actinomycetospora sp. NBRC 106375]GLZ49002.1 carbon-nitrogen hydrolase [Actinomycetospora sp. NBRC 106375]
MRIAALQARGPDRDLVRIAAAATTAADRGADVLVVPELFVGGYDPAAFPGPDETLLPRLQDLAARQGVALVAAEPEGDPPAITAVVLAGDGTVSGRYRKTHLYGPAERAAFVPGDGDRFVVAIGGLRCGVAVCYDVEFPEVVRGLALAGAEVVLVPTALDDPAVSRVLVPARAMENRVGLAYADHVGPGFCGGSVIAGPDGRARARAGAVADAVLVADVTRDDLDRARAGADYLADRRPETYR